MRFCNLCAISFFFFKKNLSKRQVSVDVILGVSSSGDCAGCQGQHHAKTSRLEISYHGFSSLWVRCSCGALVKKTRKLHRYIGIPHFSSPPPTQSRLSDTSNFSDTECLPRGGGATAFTLSQSPLHFPRRAKTSSRCTTTNKLSTNLLLRCLPPPVTEQLGRIVILSLLTQTARFAFLYFGKFIQHLFSRDRCVTSRQITVCLHRASGSW